MQEEESPPDYNSDSSDSDSDDYDDDDLNGARKSVAVAEAALKSAPLQPSLNASFTICVQHELGPSLASSDLKILLADYITIELSTLVYDYLYAIKFDRVKKPPRPEILEKVFARDLKKVQSCGVLGYGVQSGGKSVDLDEVGYVTWEDVVYAVYLTPTESYEAADHLWDAHDVCQYSWSSMQI